VIGARGVAAVMAECKRLASPHLTRHGTCIAPGGLDWPGDRVGLGAGSVLSGPSRKGGAFVVFLRGLLRPPISDTGGEHFDRALCSLHLEGW